MNKVELLAPAGDKERAYFALEYGADAIYIGAKQYSLRARASNFEMIDLREIVEYAHQKNKKVYLVTNVICHNFLLKGFKDFFDQVSMIQFDGFICADPFIINHIAKNYPQSEIHISTQQSITNSKAALFWKKFKASRIVSAREMTLEEIGALSENLKNKLELEVFIHGAVCISYSGRCMMSNNFSLRDANVGGCAQSCRWEYDILTKKEPDFNHSFTMSAKDMAYLNEIDALLKLNITSFKIEGRMKTVNYLTTVIKNYKQAIDEFYSNNKIAKKSYYKNLQLVANRPIANSFLFGDDETKMLYHDEQRILQQDFVFNIVQKINNYEYEIITKNHLNKRDHVYIVSPNQKDIDVEISTIFDLNLNKYVENLPTPMTKAIIQFTQNYDFDHFCLGKIRI